MLQSRRLFLLGSLVLVFICGAPATARPTPPAVPAQSAQGKIAFINMAAGVADIYLVAADGSGLRNVTGGRLRGVSAFSWSPDGTRLVVAADRGTNLYLVEIEGGAVRALTQNTGFAITQTPTWSPDGTRIAYVGNAAQNYDVFLINPDTSEVRRLTNTNSIYRDLAWSPDGSRLAYASGSNFFEVHIFTMRIDGGTPRQVTFGAGSDTAPAWSPDGGKLAYEVGRLFGPPEIFTVNADGTNPRRLTNNFDSDAHPTWSPDGDRIAFASTRDRVVGGTTTYAIYTMNADGSNPVRVTNPAPVTTSPAWQPRIGVTPTPGVPLLLTEIGTDRAVALDSVTMVRAPLPIGTPYNFSLDRRTRVLLFATNLDGVSDSSIMVRITDERQRLFDLKPEGVTPLPNLAGVRQIIVRLPDDLTGGGDVQVSVTAGGVQSNSAVLKLMPAR